MGCGVRKVVQGLPMRTMFLIACMYTIVYGLKELGQCLPSIERAKQIKQSVDNRAVEDIGNCLRH